MTSPPPMPEQDPHDVVESPTPAPKMHKKKRTALIWITVALLVLAGAATGAYFVLDNQHKQRVQEHELALIERKYTYSDAARDCGADLNTMEIVDDHETLIFEGATLSQAWNPRATAEDVICILDQLGAPQAVAAKMSNTRSLDGTQTATWDNYEGTWTYHPDDGLNLIIERTDEPPTLDD